MMKRLCSLVAFMPMLALAQASRIEQVLVYPGGASIERVAPVKAGTQTLRLACLSARFDADSLQARGEGLTIGDITVQTVARAELPECANNTPLEARVRELEEQQAGVAAEISAHELALGFLKRYGDAEGRGPANSTPPIAGTAEALRRSGLESLQRQQQLQRKKEELERQLAPLRAELTRQQDANAQLRVLSIRLVAKADSELHLSYRVAQAGWEPIYRAQLDTATGQLKLERHAQVAQASGEAWSGVKLRLSTAQPRQAAEMQPPRPWTLDLLPPPSNDGARQLYAPAAAMAAPAPTMEKASMPDIREAGFDVSVFQGEFATEFEVPGRATVAADNQRIALALGSVALDAKLLARAQPQLEPVAYLVAESARPAGVWPVGRLQLFRDGAFVGQSRLRLGSEEKLDLYFGRDELMRVSAEPEGRNAGSAGFIGSRAEQQRRHVYRVENLHQRRFAVQVLESTPVARHEDIKVQAKFEPKPATEGWRKQPGVLAWEFELAPAQSQTLSAEYLISYPKDARIGGMR